jgi:hypothetical protein
MDIALQNFDVHAFRAAFQMVNIIISKQISCQPFHLYTLAVWLFHSMLYVWSLHLSSCSMLFTCSEERFWT